MYELKKNGKVLTS